MKPWLSVEEAYQHDATFRTVVDAIEAMIHNAQITPHEARAAAVLACIHYEARNIRSLRIPIGESVAALDAAEYRIEELRRWIEVNGDHPYRCGEPR